MLFLNIPETAPSQVKAKFDPRAALLESQIRMEPISLSLNKQMIIVRNKYLRNLYGQCESLSSLRNYNDSKLKLVGYTTSSFLCDKLYIIWAINQYQMYPEEFLWNRCKTLTPITGYEYMHHPYYPPIINYVLPFIDSAIPDVSTYEKTTRQRSTTRSRKSTDHKNGRKRKMKNKHQTQITQDLVYVTQTQQQTCEH